MKRSLTRHRLVTALLLGVAVVPLLSASNAHAVGCRVTSPAWGSYNLDVYADSGETARLSVDGAGIYQVSSETYGSTQRCGWFGTNTTVQNTRSVFVHGNWFGKETFVLDERTGPYASVGVHVDVDLSGNYDRLVVLGGPGRDAASIGEQNGALAFGWNGHARVVTLPDHEGLRFDAGDGDDYLTAQGDVGVGAPVRYIVELEGGAGRDTLIGGEGPDALRGGPGPDTLKGMAGSDVLLGGDDGDSLTGGPGDDLAYGEGSGDYVDGGTGNDALSGGPGDDSFWIYDVNDGSDQIEGDDGTDWVDYRFRSEPLRISLDDVANDGAANEHDNVGTSIENVAGGEGPDVIVGSAAANVLGGAPGDDYIEGAGGNDVEGGGPGNDTLAGGYGNDSFYGQEGNDTFLTALPDGGDAMIGGDGFDTANYLERPSAVQIRIDGVANDGVAGEGDNVDLSTEKVIGTNYADTMVGSAAADQLWGMVGDDAISGAGGNDTIVGGPGKDGMQGGGGADTIYAHDNTAETVDGGAGSDIAQVDGEVDGGADLVTAVEMLLP